MKKKISFGITLLLMLSLLLLVLTACGEKECEHSYSSAVTKAATCKSDGVMTYTCSLCTDSYTEVIKALAHDYSEELICNSTHHYYECKCGSRKDEEKHISSGAPTATQDEICTKCGYVLNEAIGISFKTLTVDGNNVFGKVSNDTTYYSFINEINAVGGAKYIVSRNITGTDWLPAKTINLEIGDNTIYIIEMIDDEPSAIYTVIIRRIPVYTVTFDANGGTAVETQYVKEEEFAAIPETTYAGYTFAGWDYDFGTPIMSDTHITASWKANTDTKYTVEYYLENLDKSDYELIDTDEFEGTTDTTVEALIKKFDHFTFNTNKSVVSGNIDGNGILVLKVYYKRNVYKLSSANTDLGSISKSGSYVYGSIEAFEATATVSKLGYEFIGWYSKGVLVSTAQTYIFTAENNVEARFALRQEMANFNFQSTSTTCQITGIKDETVTKIVLPDFVTSIGSYAFEYCTSLTSVTIPDSVTTIGDYAFYKCTGLVSVTIPDSVTSIGYAAFSGCSSLQSITLPFVGGSKSTTSASSSTLFGYIFGTSSYTGGVATKQYASLSYYTTYYIPSSLKSVTVTGGNILFGAFSYCTSLTSVTIPNSVTSIGSYAFYSCTSLTSVAIPDSVTSIGERAFEFCSSLASVTFENPNGWWYSLSSTATSVSNISASNLSNTSTAATYLKSTYAFYYWKRH